MSIFPTYGGISRSSLGDRHSDVLMHHCCEVVVGHPSGAICYGVSNVSAGLEHRMPVNVSHRSPCINPWTLAVEQLEHAEPGQPRVVALLGVIDDVVGVDPELARFRFSLLASMRGALSSEAVAQEIAGQPRILTEGIELPGFSASDIAREATVRGLARARIFNEELLATSAVSVLLGSKSKNPRQYANKLRLRSEIVGVPHQNQYLFPLFQFDAASQAVWPAAREVNVLLDAAHDPWGVASWWVTPHGALGGRAPKDLLGNEAEQAVLVELARDIVSGE